MIARVVDGPPSRIGGLPSALSGEEGGGGGPPGGGFDPLTLGLWGYYKADEETYDDGDPAEGTDLTGNGRPLLQATSSKRPTYKTNIVDGHSVWRFDGVDDLLDTGAKVLNQPAQFVIVCRFRTAFNANNRLVSDGRGAYVSCFYRANATDMELYGGGTLGPQVTTPESWHWYEYCFDGVDSRLAVDGGAWITGWVGAGNPSGFVLGSRGDGAQDYTAIDVPELMVRDSPFDASELSDIGDYIATEYPSI